MSSYKSRLFACQTIALAKLAVRSSGRSIDPQLDSGSQPRESKMVNRYTVGTVSLVAACILFLIASTAFAQDRGEPSG